MLLRPSLRFWSPFVIFRPSLRLLSGFAWLYFFELALSFLVRTAPVWFFVFKRIRTSFRSYGSRSIRFSGFVRLILEALVFRVSFFLGLQGWFLRFGFI